MSLLHFWGLKVVVA